MLGGIPGLDKPGDGRSYRIAPANITPAIFHSSIFQSAPINRQIYMKKNYVLPGLGSCYHIIVPNSSFIVHRSYHMSKFIRLIFLFLPLLSPAQNREQLLIDPEAHADDTAKVAMYESLYQVYKDFDTDRAIQALRDMHALSRQLGCESGSETAFHLLARTYYNLHQSDSALFYYRRSLALPGVQNDTYKKANTYSGLGTAFQQKQQFDSALVCFDQAAQLIRAHNHTSLLCAVLNNMGMTIFSMGNAEKSLGYFEQAYACMLDHNDHRNIPEVVNNLASLYGYTGKGSPDKLFLDLLNNKELTPDENVKASIFLNLGSYYFGQENYVDAEKYFLRADSTFARSAIPSNPELLHSLGSLFLRKQEPEKALEYLLETFRKYPNYNQSDLLFKEIARTYLALNMPDSSRYYYEHIIARKDSTTQSAIDSVLTAARRNLDFANQAAKVHALQLETDMLQAEKRHLRMRTFALIAILLLLVILALSYLKKERDKRKFNELQLARKLADFNDKINQRNKLLSDVESKFEAYREAQTLKESLKADIIENMDLKGDGEIFAHYFEDQHKGFYTALKEIAPDLTNNDLRLCSLSRMRLSLKETALALNLSVDGVKSGRYRIRKKLDLDAETNLSDFLNEI